MSEEKTLAELMDDTAKSLLRQLSEEDSVEPVEGEAKLTLSEKVRAFGAVSDWLVARLKVAPPVKQESQFSALARKLQSPPERRKAVRRGDPGDGAPPID